MKLRFGYSFWGFIYTHDVMDTPDGGRESRPVFIEELKKRDLEIFIMQKNRDNKIMDKSLNYCNEDYPEFPELDILFLEWRWKIPGRNYEVDKKSSEYTPDYDRQMNLLNHYLKTGTKIMVWDKDLKLTEEDEKLFATAKVPVTIFENTFILSDRPIKTKRLIMTCLDKNGFSYLLNLKNKTFEVGYIGNNYERDYQFNKYLGGLSILYHDIHIWGNWTKYKDKFKEIQEQYPKIIFHDRISWVEAKNIYSQMMCSILLGKNEYAIRGQYTFRLTEMLKLGVLFFIPEEFYNCDMITPKLFIINSAIDLSNKIRYIETLKSKEICYLIRSQRDYFMRNAGELFNMKNNVDIIEREYEEK